MMPFFQLNISVIFIVKPFPATEVWFTLGQ